MLFRSAWERRQIQVEEYEIRSRKVTKDRCFVFLTDLHGNQFGDRQKKLLAAIRKARPDAVFIGGDMMVVKKYQDTEQEEQNRADLDAALFLVKELARHYPVFYGNGNHENRLDQKRKLYDDQYDRFFQELRQAGVCHLSDRSAVFEEEIVVSGLDLEPCFYEKRTAQELTKDYIIERLAEADPSRYQILLAHSPLFHKAYGDWGADLTLSGHFHGGTIRLPYLGGVMTPQFQFFHKYCSGLHWLNGKAMIVSRGLGTHSINIRLNDLPELSVIRLRAISG